MISKNILEYDFVVCILSHEKICFRANKSNNGARDEIVFL
jgi:hypothetical protein